MEKRKTFSYSRYGYLFSIPFVVAFLIFWLYPILYTAIIGFTDLKGISATKFHFLSEPFKNFFVQDCFKEHCRNLDNQLHPADCVRTSVHCMVHISQMQDQRAGVLQNCILHA